MLRITDVVKHLLIINILMFLASRVFNTGMLALYYPGSEQFMPLQFATHFFMHANLPHLLFNMYALYLFGSALESLWSARPFLLYYFVCAVGAALLHLLVNYLEFSQMQTAIDAFRAIPNYDTFWQFFKKVPLDRLNPEYKALVLQASSALQDGNPMTVEAVSGMMQQYLRYQMNIPAVGASGAIFGLLLAFAMKFPNTELMLIFVPIPIKVKYFIPILMVVELYLSVNNFAWDNIGHFAHLGGALTGLLLLLFGKYLRIYL
ncbi:MAG TPA: rhomboid family intramembrane serine protease [Saprospiraceae bacterium]|nr:rhomboid family intramembrane serine protease [Saprospiraceae bacterium]HMP13877.1 rhomboid family intramembrane serine protease [Saprospiraceae bacterium]